MTPVWDQAWNRTGDLWISGWVLYHWANSSPLHVVMRNTPSGEPCHPTQRWGEYCHPRWVFVTEWAPGGVSYFYLPSYVNFLFLLYISIIPYLITLIYYHVAAGRPGLALKRFFLNKKERKRNQQPITSSIQLYRVPYWEVNILWKILHGKKSTWWKYAPLRLSGGN